MKQSLHLRLGQQLTMTPQLQQAIKLLQLSSLDLQQEIQEALDSNVMLEVDETNSNTSSDTDNSNNDNKSDSVDLNTLDNKNNEHSNELNNQPSNDDFTSEVDNSQVDFENSQNDIPTELTTDSSWDDTYDTSTSYTAGQSISNSYSGDDSNLFENNGKTEDSLQEHLIWQAEMTPFSDTDRMIADAIIDGIDDSGYLTQSYEELLQSFSPEDEIDIEEIEAVLHRIQNFDPPGVGARDLQENLLLQLRALDSDTQWLSEAKILVSRHLKLLANRDFATLKRRMKLDETRLAQVISLIKSLSPRPGSHISDDKPHYVTPDVYVKKINGAWTCSLNSDSAPNIKINEEYLNLVKGAKKDSDMSSIKDHLQEARWFIKSLQSRNETLLKVSRCILDFQKDFFEYGEEHMRALVLADVAEVVEMHESTISRVTTQKYMHTPGGIFELKYFFSSHVTTASGGEASATAIRAIIKKFIAAENSRKPLSDNKISTMLAEQNYKVARRTVAKYRESMSIPPSNERKNIA
ncbi:MAG: RNA polymerase factor sigma-54 [gamma proteobacterium symbiont of Bathyaustriella thionipta]|nr:RNA polymerase factor sigma-54 [gamma proteobacterium symbiont of Bathyaustriella thionipta]MCU7948436.1 RNA polymerase factor sigma-54 [gamma proteobacterium symbiont of Bathyaustriella thionipta]MCU7954135.1 RNA polymerase factor sigma-54 [gamma proteobacterium symbiont of Bathyaustriella thionipta]MCU7955986.1 RNA polymerase factor sigma-54 [gamma proteobacterium symbiont of Bathyaustriella thionipta]MCU7968157.1 RNA polymerase factor sigma-54 [gamma proteobacterium symbiont of Bathyaustr